MTHLDTLIGFETEIGLINDAINKPATDDSLFWINQAIGKFVKLRFNGDFAHKQGFEQTEKRRADLIKLFRSYDFTTFTKSEHPSYMEYYVDYNDCEDEFMYALNEDVVISDIDGTHLMDTCVFECTRDSFMYRVNNSLTDFHYIHHRARPIRIREANGCSLLTDKKYKITKYTLGYLKKPTEITLERPHDEYEDFDDVTMNEIIKMAALMYLENTASQRYQTISQEVLTQE